MQVRGGPAPPTGLGASVPPAGAGSALNLVPCPPNAGPVVSLGAPGAGSAEGDSRTAAASASRDPYREFDAGMLVSVHAMNFMCHHNLYISFVRAAAGSSRVRFPPTPILCHRSAQGPKVNFINGRNGSGKSSIIAALQVRVAPRRAGGALGHAHADARNRGAPRPPSGPARQTPTGARAPPASSATGTTGARWSASSSSTTVRSQPPDRRSVPRALRGRSLTGPRPARPRLPPAHQARKSSGQTCSETGSSRWSGTSCGRAQRSTRCRPCRGPGRAPPAPSCPTSAAWSTSCASTSASRCGGEARQSGAGARGLPAKRSSCPCAAPRSTTRL